MLSSYLRSEIVKNLRSLKKEKTLKERLQSVIPKVRYSEGSNIPKVRYSEGSKFRTFVIPKVR